MQPKKTREPGPAVALHLQLPKSAWPPYGDWETEGSSGRAQSPGLRVEAGDSQAEGQGAIVQVDEAAHDVPRCPRLPGGGGLTDAQKSGSLPILPPRLCLHYHPGEGTKSAEDLSPRTTPHAQQRLVAAQ